MCSGGRRPSWPCPQGVMVVQQEAGWVRKGHYSSCFLSVGGPRGVFDDRDERLDDLSSPLPHTSLSPTCVSQCQVNMVTQRACRSAMCFHGRTGSAAQQHAPARIIFTPFHLPSVAGIGE